MGMTIDKTVEFFNGLECHTPQAKDVAVDTMRKYQKIEEAYKKYLNDMAYFTNIYADLKFIRVLREVLEDGNKSDPGGRFIVLL